MKFKRTVLFATFVVTMGLLLGISAAQAQEVIFDETVPTKAIGILGLVIDGTTYNVDFTLADARSAYDPGFPDDFDFNTSSSAQAAVNAVNSALDAEEVLFVGEPGIDDQLTSQFYLVGWSWEAGDSGAGGIVSTWQGTNFDPFAPDNIGEGWIASSDFVFDFEARFWAKFTLAGPPPDPVTIGGSVSGLEGSGLVLQNNGGDDEAIDADGPFTFDTALTPGTSYNVTVATNPSGQVCAVANGSGRVPPEDVTDVVVLCTTPVASNTFKIAAEGDTLRDGTVLKDIFLDGGVGINMEGKVVFGGRDDSVIDTIFTQDGKVVSEDDTLDDGTTLDAFRAQGEVAISTGLAGDRVAFHGMAENGLTDIAAVFNQAGVVTKEGDSIARNTKVSDIDPLGKVAINDLGQLAFHGNVEIESGLRDEKHRVVFISDGQETREAARDGSNLPDDTLLEDITVSGGVAINNLGEVAFHGETGDSVKAVFNSSEGLVAKVGDKLPDGTLVDDIDNNGGVAINVLGEVAFHGNIDVNRNAIAVFTSEGAVALLGGLTTKGNIICGIEASGGVAINLFGEVAFHGFVCIGGTPFKAVYIATADPEGGVTRPQVIAKVGDFLDDGSTILSDISAGSGVAINLYGEVVFHGKIGATDAVFQSSAVYGETSNE